MEIRDNWPKKLLACLFVLILFIQVADHFLHILPSNINLEKKSAGEIKLDIYHPNRFLSESQKQFNENFNGRSALFVWFCRYKINFFKSSPLPDHVLLGKNNWLYYSIGKAEDDWRGISLLSEEKLVEIKNNLEKTSEWFDNRGIKYYHVLVPDKDKIYPEHLPGNIKIIGHNFQSNQIKEYLKKSDCKVIYLRDTLLAQKNVGKLYFESDHHWNKLGAFIGYSNLMKELKKDFPLLIPKKLEDYTVEMSPKKGGDLAYMMGLQDSYTELIPVFKPKFKSVVQEVKNDIEVPSYFTNNPSLYAISRRNDDGSLPKILVFRDSFASAIIPFLQENFRESLFIWDWHLEKVIIEKEKPDIVLRLTNERNINALCEGVVGKVQ